MAPETTSTWAKPLGLTPTPRLRRTGRRGGQAPVEPASTGPETTDGTEAGSTQTAGTDGTGSTGGTGTATVVYKDDRLDPAGRLIELLAIVVLGVATVTTAWCGFQSVQWSNRSGEQAQVASDAHVEAARQFGAAVQIVSFDANTVTAYAAAKAAGNEKLMDFYRSSLMRPGFLPVLDRWEAQIEAGEAPTSLTQDQAYLDEQFAGYRKTLATGDEAAKLSQAAAQNTGQYVGLTIILAMALFFAGVTSSFRHRLTRMLLLVASSLTLVYALTRLIGLPITW